MNKSDASNESHSLRFFHGGFSTLAMTIGVGSVIALLLLYFARENVHEFFLHNPVGHLIKILAGAAAPYVGIFLAVFVTWTLVVYLHTIQGQNSQITKLALSLGQANEELNQRIADEARMARALQSSEQRYRDLFENAGIGICQIAPSGEWHKANYAAAQILGYDNPQELLAAQPDFHGKLFANKEQRSEWFDKLRAGNQRGFETELYTRGGGRIWVTLSGYAVEDNGKPFFECILFDITAKRRDEMALIKAKENADFANRSKSEFLANMSHELRTPLNAIIGFAEIIKGQMFGPVGKPQYVEYANDIYDSGDLLLSLINDILDMSKIEAGKRTLAEVVLSVDKVVDSVIRLVAARAKTSKLHLHNNITKDLPNLRGEEKALKQILTNLLTNAIKFTPEGGDVTLSAGMDEAKRLYIRVTDTGIGIAPEDISVALAPFGQIESVLSRKNQGTGLGLPMTKALTELHGGTLEIQSKLDSGTSVTATFPADRVIRKTVSA